jgi:hypothetical protein
MFAIYGFCYHKTYMYMALVGDAAWYQAEFGGDAGRAGGIAGHLW